SSRREPSPGPIHAAPRTVEPTAAVVGARVLDTAWRTKARTKDDRKPPAAPRRRRSRARHRVEDEGKDERRQESTEQPHDSARFRAEEREEYAAVDGGRERSQGSRRRHELVYRDDRGDGEQREQPPAAEPH